MNLELDANGANRASFPDCLIESFTADDRRISFRSDSIFIDNIGFIGPNADVQCVISGSVRGREYNDGHWNNLHLSPGVGLREIGDWNADGGTLTFAGFEAVSGLWAEYEVNNFSMSLTVTFR